jgi:hypothetical protein
VDKTEIELKGDVLMGSTVSGPEYTGMDKYPGWIATIITIAVSSIFIGALFVTANSHDAGHDEGHEADHSGSSSSEEGH